MTNLFRQIDDFLSQNQDGWCTKEKAHMLAMAVLLLRPKIALEVGVWSGKSLIPMAMAMKYIGAGRVIAIDPWSPQASAEGQEGEHKKWWSEADHERVFNVFIAWLERTGTNPFVDVQRCRSDQFNPPPQIGLASIDGNHGDECSIYDVEHYATKVVPGGFCFFDDTAWARKACAMLPGLGFKEIYRPAQGEDWAMFQRLSL